MTEQRQATKDPAVETLGSRLRSAREYLGLTQEFVAAELGIPRASVGALEAEKRKVSSAELQHLSRLYGVPVSALLDEGRGGPEVDATTRALYRATRELTNDDREQVVRFAEFLRAVGKRPSPDLGDDGDQ